MGRSMKTMDGNHAAAHASYAYSDVAAIYPITLHLLWQKLLMSGLPREERTFLDRKFRLRRCSLRPEQQVLYTVLLQQAL